MNQKKPVKRLLWGMMLIVLILMLPGAIFASGGEDGGMSVDVGGYSIHLILLEPATTGENLFHVQIFDQMGMAVDGAQVHVSNVPVDGVAETHETMDVGAPEMSDIGAMDAAVPAPEHADHTSGTGETNHTSIVESDSEPGEQHGSHDGEQVEPAKTLLEQGEEAGEYTGAITFQQAGPATLTVHFTINGVSLEAQFPLEVTRSGSVYAILGGFLALNFTIIGSAAILKRKNAPASSI